MIVHIWEWICLTIFIRLKTPLGILVDGRNLYHRALISTFGVGLWSLCVLNIFDRQILWPFSKSLLLLHTVRFRKDKYLFVLSLSYHYIIKDNSSWMVVPFMYWLWIALNGVVGPFAHYLHNPFPLKKAMSFLIIELSLHYQG